MNNKDKIVFENRTPDPRDKKHRTEARTSFRNDVTHIARTHARTNKTKLCTVPITESVMVRNLSHKPQI